MSPLARPAPAAPQPADLQPGTLQPATAPATLLPPAALPARGERRSRGAAAAPTLWADAGPYLQRLEGLLGGCRGQARLGTLLVVEVLPANPQAAGPLMQAIGQRLCQGLRATDEVSQLGGDRFAVLLFDAGEGVSAAVRERLDRALRQPYAVASPGAAPAWPLLRVGRAVLGLDGQRATELLQAASLRPGEGD